MNDKWITLGIDASTTNIGIATYINGSLKDTKNLLFKDKFSLTKLELIIASFSGVLQELTPDFVIVEEPITAQLRNTRSISALNQVAGALVATSKLYGAKTYMMHNKTIKSAFGIKHKHDVKYLLERMYPHLKDEELTEHELDAILVVEAYMQLYINQEN